MRICRYDGNLELLRSVFKELYSYDEIDKNMWYSISEMGNIANVDLFISGLSRYDKIRCITEESDGEFGFDEEFFAGDKWFADGVRALGTIGCLIGDNQYCLVKGYDEQYELFTVSYLDENDVPDVTVPALTENPGDFVVGVPALVGTYKYAILIMKRQEGN